MIQNQDLGLRTSPDSQDISRNIRDIGWNSRTVPVILGHLATIVSSPDRPDTRLWQLRTPLLYFPAVPAHQAPTLFRGVARETVNLYLSINHNSCQCWSQTFSSSSFEVCVRHGLWFTVVGRNRLTVMLEWTKYACVKRPSLTTMTVLLFIGDRSIFRTTTLYKEGIAPPLALTMRTNSE